MRYLFLLLLLVFLLSGCSDTEPTTAEGPIKVPAEPSLASAFADDFRIGAALGRRQLRGGDAGAMDLVRAECNTITPENDMKWGRIHPARDTFNWELADAFVEFGEENDMFIVGHALVWYLQLADYVGEVTDPEEMRTVLKEHIDAVAGRYRGRIDAWDVLNEAVEEDGSVRKWPVCDVLGESYVAEVFKMARAATPDAALYYNDYNAWNPAKRAGIVKMIKTALAAGAPIDGIGIQAHYGLERPTIAEIEAAIEDYAALGLTVMITELDVSVLPSPYDNPTADPRISFESTPYMNPYPDPDALPDSVNVALAGRYTELFELFLKHRDDIDRVTFWGVYDGSTWLNNWPVKGRTNYPMLFDRKYQRKPAYAAVMGLKGK